MRILNGNKMTSLSTRAAQRLLALSIATGLLALLPIYRAWANDEGRYDGWYFTAEEIRAAYSYQESYGERLRNPLRASGCMLRGGEFSARHGKTAFLVPCRFVEQVTRHLKEMVDQGAARFLFPLDADHAHLGVPMSSWKEKYQYLSADEVVPALLRDPGLVALYHTAEHLRVTDRKTGEVDFEAKAWLDKRNVLGYFDGRPITILPPQAAGQGASMPEEYYSYSGFSFLASSRGELYLSVGTRMVVFDIAFDATHADGFAELGDSDAVRLTQTER
jgi:hypothetical protein